VKMSLFIFISEEEKQDACQRPQTGRKTKMGIDGRWEEVGRAIDRVKLAIDRVKLAVDRVKLAVDRVKLAEYRVKLAEYRVKLVED
jgi:hypothetical protein